MTVTAALAALTASDGAPTAMPEGRARRIPIALVEDNERLRMELAFHLTHAGYAVASLADAAALDAHLASQPCRLLILDLGLPDEDGLSICERLRRTRPDLGIVMLTARGMAHHRLAGLRGGADAYLVKPARTEELLLVIANLLRRLDPVTPDAPLPPAAGAPAPAWCLDARRLMAITPDGNPLPLTRVEGQLLRALRRRAPDPAGRRQLVEALGGNYLDFDEHRLDVAISRLRGKLSQAWPHGPAIRTVRGVGYLLVQRWLDQAEG
ncbi:response regulator transcription factor [Cupriavidus basilensis]|uniref:Response regulator transcription factor n=1 Tax=Cupriavidus basilensis TaxID=68895 RepID=A0A643FKF1_9BURK|nr:response regulator transcription factor [Cupriavidus basilensis]QOT76835.1 response regulator transcription factor [Cupriavidus basilensis]